ncbi:glycosyltransferase [Aureispira anguillae]|uniref:Glycosyltransferase family 2 protein n=1 Tax=Aureispira anguillae TaxID=2864201 RepID=A0A915YLT1_9BACT|nr:glycosyltransferase [Aureispira anguillae]BDS15587.1 glycosyltransferase family 2 protein [Aureispira anguillae]
MLALFSILIGGYLALASFYMLLFAIGAKVNSTKTTIQLSSKVSSTASMAVFIPAYKEDAVIVEVATKALAQDYNNYTVIVIADSLKPVTLERLKELPIEVVEVDFEQSTKVKALNHAMNQLTSNYEIAVILDADNVMEAQFLAKMNVAYHQGAKVIQGRRIAKNKTGSYALLDALSEAINNNIYNLGQINLGFSARLVGSGMAFEYDLFKRLMQDSVAVGGFDKELELKLLEQKAFIHYVDNAIVWDEKVSKVAVFAKQRRRWLAAQYHYLKEYGGRAIRALFLKGNLDFFNKICQMALPPRLLLPVFLAMGSVLTYLLGSNTAWIWFWGLLANLMANLISIPKEMFTIELFKALIKLPIAIFFMFFSLFKIKGANKKFYHTPHGEEK